MKSRQVKRGFWLVGAAALAMACSRPKSVQQNLEQQLVGKWEGVSTQLLIETEGRTERSHTINVSEGEWETRMYRTPPQMEYFADHRYASTYVLLIDAEGRETRDTVRQDGSWRLEGDTLVIEEPNLSVPYSRFKLKMASNQLEISCKMDIDGDGEMDDSYWMLQRRR